MNFIITVLVWLGIIPKSVVPLIPAIEKALPEIQQLVGLIIQVTAALDKQPDQQKQLASDITDLLGSYIETQKEAANK